MYAQVDSVKNRPRDLSEILSHFRIITMAAIARISVPATWTGVRCCHKHEVSRHFYDVPSPRNGDKAIFQRLPQGIEKVLWQLRDFIDKQNTMVSQGNLSRSNVTAPTNHTSGTYGMMRCSKWWGIDKLFRTIRHVGYRPNLRDFDRLLWSELR